MLRLAIRSHANHLPRQLCRARARHELHYQKAARLRLPSHDAAAPDSRCPAVEVLPGEDYSQRTTLLFLFTGVCANHNIESLFLAVHDLRPRYGGFSASLILCLSADVCRCVRYMSWCKVVKIMMNRDL